MLGTDGRLYDSDFDFDGDGKLNAYEYSVMDDLVFGHEDACTSDETELEDDLLLAGLNETVLGEISIGGTLIKVEDLASTLQVCLDSGAKKVLLPITSAADLGTVPSDLVGAFSLIFYSSPEEAVYKALGVE